MVPNNLTPEQKEKVLACKTSEELFALAKEEGYALSAEEIESISGGDSWTNCDFDYNFC